MNIELLKRLYPSVTFYGEVSIKDSVSIGNGTKIGEYVVIGANTKIGKKCIILYHVTLSKDCVIGNNVFIGPNTTFLNDMFPPSKISRGPVIEDSAIIGGGVTIRPNVTIGRRSVVACGSTVTHNIPFGQVWMGNPAKFHCFRAEYDKKKKEWEKLWRNK